MQSVRLTLLLLAVLSVVPFSGAFAQQPIKLSIFPERNAFVFSEPIILRCVFSNESDEAATLDMGRNDVEKVSFAIRPELPSDSPSVRFPYSIRQGGGDFSTAIKLAPHAKAIRRIVLDQWYRPVTVNNYRLECFIGPKEQAITASCIVPVTSFNSETLNRNLEADVQLYQEMKDHFIRLTDGEERNYQRVLMTIFSYVAHLPGDALKNVEQKHPERLIRDLIEDGRTRGPGGSLVLD